MRARVCVCVCLCVCVRVCVCVCGGCTLASSGEGGASRIDCTSRRCACGCVVWSPVVLMCMLARQVCKFHNVLK